MTFQWAAFYAAIGGRYAFLALQVACICFAAWVTYGWRTDHMVEGSGVLAELVELDVFATWTDWEACN